MSLLEYLEANFGISVVDKIKRIRTGGDNNRKGSEYETYYAAAKICDIAANDLNFRDVWLSSQDLAFVDDFCVWNKRSNHKENYQAKNSSGIAASWTHEIENRFRLQRQIDEVFHQCSSSRQILLVSCVDKARENELKINNQDKADFCSEYFPYHQKSTYIIYLSEKLRGDLETLCGTEDLSILDAAYRCVISAWQHNDDARTVYDIVGKAKSLSKPNVFSDLVSEQTPLPDWIHRLCATFPGIEGRVVCDRFIISYNGFEISISDQVAAPISKELEALTDISKLIEFLMIKSTMDLIETEHNDAEGATDER